MKTVSILLALVNSLAAGLVIASSLSGMLLRLATSVWLTAKVLASLGIIAVGVLTWLAACRSTNQTLVLLAGLFLVALGTAAAVWTIHLALVSGHMKNHMFLYGGSLMTQGAFSIWNLLPGQKSTTAA